MTLAVESERDDVAGGASLTEPEFREQALEFLSRHADRRGPDTLLWGEGTERLTIFHETTGEEEQREVAAARRWQATRWAAGFGWLTGPVKYGGRGLPVDFDRVYRALEADFDVPDVSPLRVGLSTVGPALLASGTEDQVRQYCVGIYRGEVVACQLFSEPDAGSDLANVKTRAIRDGDGWRVTGQKVWTSNAQFADIGLALVRSDPDAPKHRGLTVLLVPMRDAAVEVRPLRQLTGGASFTEVFLDDVFVPDELRVGDANEGWRVATNALTAERTSTGDRSHSMTSHAFQLLTELAARTHANADLLRRQELADLFVRLEVARTYQRMMQAKPASELRGPERAIDKLLLTDNLRRLGDAAGRLLGPALAADSGAWGTYAWSKWVLGATGYRLGGGTDEVLKTMIGERMLGLPREPT
jgi:alkylation response protein AidB-like acyl-CoA dehydrogenase